MKSQNGDASPLSDLVVSVFRLVNNRYLMVPKLEFSYQENGTDIHWHISAGGSRAYLIRHGKGLSSNDAVSVERQGADSHFMSQRVVIGLLLGCKGLFEVEPRGRIFVSSIDLDKISWFTQLNLPTTEPETDVDSVIDWIQAVSKHTMLRRAAADAYAALLHPHEAGLFVYRGLEWLVMGEGRSWEDLAGDMGVSKGEMKEFKKLVNLDYGVRHASRSGIKLRATVENYGTWVCALLDALNATRSRLEKGYVVATPENVAAAVTNAMLLDPYP